MDWPTIRVLYFLPGGNGLRLRLVDAGPHVSLPPTTATPPHGNGSHYMLRELRAGPALRSLPRRGLRVGMSALGDLRIWHRGRICAAQSAQDCQRDGGWRLAPEDIAYLDAYLVLVGDTMRDAF